MPPTTNATETRILWAALSVGVASFVGYSFFAAGGFSIFTNGFSHIEPLPAVQLCIFGAGALLGLLWRWSSIRLLLSSLGLGFLIAIAAGNWSFVLPSLGSLDTFIYYGATSVGYFGMTVQFQSPVRIRYMVFDCSSATSAMNEGPPVWNHDSLRPEVSAR